MPQYYTSCLVLTVQRLPVGDMDVRCCFVVLLVVKLRFLPQFLGASENIKYLELHFLLCSIKAQSFSSSSKLGYRTGITLIQSKIYRYTKMMVYISVK